MDTVTVPIAGFYMPDVSLPRRRTDISLRRRRRAAEIVASVVRGATPEDLATGEYRDIARAALNDRLEADECLSVVDALLAVLAPTEPSR